MEKQLTLDLQIEVNCQPAKPVAEVTRPEVWAAYAAKCREEKLSNGDIYDRLKEIKENRKCT